MPINRMYEDELKDQTEYYQDWTQPYLKEDLPEDQSYPALSQAPKEVLRDPSKKLPADRSPVDYPVGDSRLDAERGQRYKTKVYTEQLYDAISKGEDINTAREKARNLATMADVGQALAGMATAGSVGRGGPGADKSIYEGMRQRAANLPREAEEDRKAKIADYLTKRKMGQEATEELAGSRKEDEAIKIQDPESDISRSYQQMFKTTYGKYLKDFEKQDPNTGDTYNAIDTMSAADLMKANELLKGRAQLDMAGEMAQQRGSMAQQAIDLQKEKLGLGREALGIQRDRMNMPRATTPQRERSPEEIDALKAKAELDRARAAALGKDKEAAVSPTGEPLSAGEDIPNSLRSKALTEKKAFDEFKKVKDNVLRSYDEGGKFSVIKGNAPSWMGGARSEYQAYRAMIASQVINKVPGIRSDSDFRNIVEPMLPSPGDPKDTITTKKKVFADFINSVSPETTTYDSIYGSSQKSETPPSSMPLVTPDMAGSKMINGVLYKKVPGGWRKAQ